MRDLERVDVINGNCSVTKRWATRVNISHGNYSHREPNSIAQLVRKERPSPGVFIRCGVKLSFLQGFL